MAKPKSYINPSYEAMAGYGAPAQEGREFDPPHREKL